MVVGEVRRSGGDLAIDPSDRSAAAISLVVIAPVRFYRDGLAALFAERDGFAVAATAVDREDGLARIRERSPDIVLVALAPSTGPTLVREIVATAPDTSVIVLGVRDDDPEVLPLAEAGAAGYVTTEASADELVHVVEGVARGEMPCSPRLAATLLRRVAVLAQERGTRARDRRAHRRRPVEQGDRAQSQHRSDDGEEPRAQHPREAERATPRRRGRTHAQALTLRLNLAI